MSNKDIGNLYRDILEGREYISEKNITQLYTEVLGNISDPYALSPKKPVNIPEPKSTRPNGPRHAPMVKPTDDDCRARVTHPETGESLCLDCDPGSEDIHWSASSKEWLCVPKDVKDIRTRSAMLNADDPEANKTTGYNTVINYLQDKGYVKGSLDPNHLGGLHQSLTHGVYADDPDDWNVWLQFVRNASSGNVMRIEEKPIGVFNEVLKEYGFSDSLISRLIDQKYTDAGGSNVGPGEIALSLIFKDVRNTDPDQSGDLRLEIGGMSTNTGVSEGEVDEEGAKEIETRHDTALEVKGQGGHFGQQGGRGGVEFNALKQGIKNITDKITGFSDFDKSDQVMSGLLDRYKKLQGSTLPLVDFLDVSYRIVKRLNEQFSTDVISIFLEMVHNKFRDVYPHAGGVRGKDKESGPDMIPDYLSVEVFEQHITQSAVVFDDVTNQIAGAAHPKEFNLTAKKHEKMISDRQATDPMLKFYDSKTGKISQAQYGVNVVEGGLHMSPLKGAFLKLNAKDYLGKHGYEKILFIDKGNAKKGITAKYVLFNAANIETMIDEGRFNTESDNPVTGYSTKSLYPSLRYKFQ